MEYGLYMICVACMIFAHGVAVKFVIALLLMATDEKGRTTKVETRQKSNAISPTPKAPCQKPNAKSLMAKA